MPITWTCKILGNVPPVPGFTEDGLTVRQGFRILSAYTLSDGTIKVWAITEADRTSTATVLPEDY